MINQYKLISYVAGYPFKQPVSDMLGTNMERVIISTENPLDDSTSIFEIIGNRIRYSSAKVITLHIIAKIIRADNRAIYEMAARLWNLTLVATDTDTLEVKAESDMPETALELSQQELKDRDVFPVTNILTIF